MTYSIAASLFFCLGLLGTRGIVWALLALSCLPIGNAFGAIFYVNGLYAYDFYFISAYLILIRRGFDGELVFVKSPLLYVVLLVLLYALVSLYSGQVDKYYLRDFRLLIFLLYGYYFIAQAASGYRLSSQVALLLVLASALSCIGYAAASQLELFSFNDVFYERNAFRYFAVSSYICATYFALSAYVDDEQKELRLYPFVVALSFVALALTGFRLLTALALFLYVVTRLTTKRGVAVAVVAPTVLIYIVVGMGDQQLLERLLSVDLSVIQKDILSRYSPFFALIESYSDYEIFFGRGFGVVFDIPWFYYRENQDVLNNFVDSTYLTLFAKLGVFSFVYLAVLTGVLARQSVGLDSPSIFWPILFLAGVYIVYCVPYQITGVGLIVGFYLLRRGGRGA